MTDPISIVKACRDFFEKDPHGRKIDIPEFKSLTHEDKVELREMLIKEGYDVLPLAAPENISE